MKNDIQQKHCTPDQVLLVLIRSLMFVIKQFFSCCNFRSGLDWLLSGLESWLAQSVRPVLKILKKMGWSKWKQQLQSFRNLHLLQTWCNTLHIHIAWSANGRAVGKKVWTAQEIDIYMLFILSHGRDPVTQSFMMISRGPVRALRKCQLHNKHSKRDKNNICILEATWAQLLLPRLAQHQPRHTWQRFGLVRRVCRPWM